MEIQTLYEKVSKFEAFSGPHFSVIGLNTEICNIRSPYSARLQENMNKKNSQLENYSRSGN